MNMTFPKPCDPTFEQFFVDDFFHFCSGSAALAEGLFNKIFKAWCSSQCSHEDLHELGKVPRKNKYREAENTSGK